MSYHQEMILQRLKLAENWRLTLYNNNQKLKRQLTKQPGEINGIEVIFISIA